MKKYLLLILAVLSLSQLKAVTITVKNKTQNYDVIEVNNVHPLSEDKPLRPPNYLTKVKNLGKKIKKGQTKTFKFNPDGDDYLEFEAYPDQYSTNYMAMDTKNYHPKIKDNATYTIKEHASGAPFIKIT